MTFDEVNEVNVYTCTGQPLPTDIAMIVEWMLNESFALAYQSKRGVLWSRKYIFMHIFKIQISLN